MPALDEVGIGKSGRVTRIDLKTEDSRRFMEMGLTVGTTVKVLKLAPLGDPMEILVRGYHLSLRQAEARHIEVDEIPA